MIRLPRAMEPRAHQFHRLHLVCLQLLQAADEKKANPHFGPFHLLSFALIGGGFMLIAGAWRVLYHAQQRHALATTGPTATSPSTICRLHPGDARASSCSGRRCSRSQCSRCSS